MENPNLTNQISAQIPASLIDKYNSMQNWEELLIAFRQEKIRFSKSEAIRLIGGRRVLERLVAAKKIRLDYADRKPFARWNLFGEDVIKFINYKYKEHKIHKK
jgi:hypothetical protein